MSIQNGRACLDRCENCFLEENTSLSVDEVEIRLQDQGSQEQGRIENEFHGHLKNCDAEHQSGNPYYFNGLRDAVNHFRATPKLNAPRSSGKVGGTKCPPPSSNREAIMPTKKAKPSTNGAVRIVKNRAKRTATAAPTPMTLMDLPPHPVFAVVMPQRKRGRVNSMQDTVLFFHEDVNAARKFLADLPEDQRNAVYVDLFGDVSL
jgi:hypothetical protein